MNLGKYGGLCSSFRRTLKNLDFQNRNRAIWSLAFCGEGFYVHNINKVVNYDLNLNVYDLHWAYGGSLINYNYPLSDKLQKQKTKNEHFIAIICFDNYCKKYNDFYYNIFLKKIIKKNNKYYLVLCDIDLVIFLKLYKLKNFKILKKFYITNFGKLPVGTFKWVNRNYVAKKNCNDKIEYEASVYGRQAQKVGKFKTQNGTICDFRDRYVAIALYQSAWVRFYEFLQFLKFKNDIVYMNTDSIHIIDKNQKIKTSEDIGCYDIKFKNVNIFYIRRNCYIVFKNNKIIDKILGGIEDSKQINLNKINKLKIGQKVYFKQKNKNNKEIKMILSPLFINEFIET